VIQLERKKFDIIVPIFNAWEFVEPCLSSVMATLQRGDRLILADDASTDVSVVTAIKKLAWDHSHVVLVRSPKNRGYLINVNHAISQTHQDVVLLNSDTLVPSHWLQSISDALTSDNSIGVVSPYLSKGAHLSFPSKFLNLGGQPLSHFSEISRLVKMTSQRIYPRIPAGIGACMAIRRELLLELDQFDLSFSPGYFEEIDYCFRARSLGFHSVCADDTLVWHHETKSFTSLKRKALQKRNRALLEFLWPEECKELADFYSSGPFRAQASLVDSAIEALAKRSMNHSDQGASIGLL
jgi:GT2 family glycosyltransferase